VVPALVRRDALAPESVGQKQSEGDQRETGSADPDWKVQKDCQTRQNEASSA
jgi:hypothetical protein